MANLEKKILDGDNVGYCSSSDEETPSSVPQIDTSGGLSASQYRLSSAKKGENTGPKGVLADYKHFQEEIQIKKRKKQKEVFYFYQF